MIQLLSRVAHLLALLFAPKLLVPEPSEADGVLALFGALALVLPILGSIALFRRYESLESKVAVALWALADIALVSQAHFTLANGVPLLRGFYIAAPPVWAALGATLATLAAQHLGVSFKNKRAGAFVITVAIGIFIFRDAHEYVASTRAQWFRTLDADPAHEQALLALADDLADPASSQRLEACVSRRPDACVCRTIRAERAVERDRFPLALEEIQEARCEDTAWKTRSATVRALSLALLRRYDEAAELLASTADDPSNKARRLLTSALVAHGKGQTEALDLARQAAAAGAGRTAELMVIELSIQRNQVADAQTELAAYLKKHPDDPPAVFNAALLTEGQGDYNKTREAYHRFLRLRLDPEQSRTMGATARYKLAMLAYNQGALDEARNSARKFAESYPDDPRKDSLLTLVGLAL
ncbi:MAG: tetratricopeptide repeat protein [Polyangiaceae bacterium]|nr:tetratricopeptide repeat protein [Polyangiaceae bacterium]